MRKIATSLLVVAIMLVVSAASVSAEKYEVEKGDSLWDIADQYQMSVDELVSINDLKTTVIQPKQEIIISETYIVERGDTLSKIAKEYGVKVNQIKEWNNLESDLIVIGEELVLNEAEKATEPEPEKEQASEPKEEAEPVATESAEEQTEQPAEDASAEQAEEETDNTTNEESNPTGETLEMTATAYTAECDGCSGVTYTGVDLKNDRDKKVIAVDPDVIPLGTKVYVEGYGYAVAEDIGGAIKGNKIDLHVPSKEDAYNWGVQTVNVTIVE